MLRRSGFASVVPMEPMRPTEEPSEDGVDVSLIRWMMSLTPSERLDVLQGFVDDAVELRGGG